MGRHRVPKGVVPRGAVLGGAREMASENQQLLRCFYLQGFSEASVWQVTATTARSPVAGTRGPPRLGLESCSSLRPHVTFACRDP